MKTYVINLTRAPDRRAHMTAELQSVGADYEFVEAVDGRDVDVGDPGLVAASWLGRSPFWPNVAGCALSHLAVYERVIQEGLDAAVVLEDDVKLPRDLNALADSVAPSLEGAEVVLLHYHSVKPCRISMHGSVGLPGGRQLGYPVDIKECELGSAGAYIITAEACERMAKAILPVQVPADEWSFFYEQGVFDRLRCVFPLPVSKAADFRSTIGYHDERSWKALVSTMTDKMHVPLVKKALSRRRQRIHDMWSRVELVDEVSPLEKP